jgi:hypothetical protein
MATCKRPGCRRPGHNGRDYCTLGCLTATEQLQSARHVRNTLGESEQVDEYLHAAEELLTCWQRTQDARNNLRLMAMSAGWTAQQWSQLLRGQIDVTT